MLGLTRQTSRAWHRARLREELDERRRAPSRLLRLSETADVVFSISRARYDGFAIAPLPGSIGGVPVYAYMLGKFSLRWGFYRVAAALCRGRGRGGNAVVVREVVNPSKDAKLAEVAARQGPEIDAAQFVQIARRLRRVWPLLP